MWLCEHKKAELTSLEVYNPMSSLRIGREYIRGIFVENRYIYDIDDGR